MQTLVLRAKGSTVGGNSDRTLHSVIFRSGQELAVYMNRLLPQTKNTGYNLRQRTHDLTLPTDISAIMKQNFVYRMLFRDIY